MALDEAAKDRVGLVLDYEAKNSSLIAECSIAIQNQQAFSERQLHLVRSDCEVMLQKKLEEARQNSQLDQIERIARETLELII